MAMEILNTQKPKENGMKNNMSKYECLRCKSNSDNCIVGTDYWSEDDIVTYIKCLKCDLLFWFSSFLNKTNTNWNDAK